MHSFHMQITKTTSNKSIWTDLKLNLSLKMYICFLLKWSRAFYNSLVNRLRCLKAIDLLHLRGNSVFKGILKLILFHVYDT